MHYPLKTNPKLRGSNPGEFFFLIIMIRKYNWAQEKGCLGYQIDLFISYNL